MIFACIEIYGSFLLFIDNGQFFLFSLDPKLCSFFNCEKKLRFKEKKGQRSNSKIRSS